MPPEVPASRCSSPSTQDYPAAFWLDDANNNTLVYVLHLLFKTLFLLTWGLNIKHDGLKTSPTSPCFSEWCLWPWASVLLSGICSASLILPEGACAKPALSNAFKVPLNTQTVSFSAGRSVLYPDIKVREIHPHDQILPGSPSAGKRTFFLSPWFLSLKFMRHLYFFESRLAGSPCHHDI